MGHFSWILVVKIQLWFVMCFSYIWRIFLYKIWMMKILPQVQLISQTVSTMLFKITPTEHYLLNESVFNFQSESSFQNRGTNGLVFETKYESKKVVIHLHQSTLLLHMQGASCIKWFECIFNNIAMEIHNIHDSALFSEENYIAQSSTLDTSERDVVTQHDNRYFDRECCLYKCNRNTMWCQHSNALINPQDTLYK